MEFNTFSVQLCILRSHQKFFVLFLRPDGAREAPLLVFLSGGRKHRSVTFDVRLYRRFEISPLHPTPHVPESQFPKPCQECNQPSKLALPPVSPMCLMCPCERLSLTIRLTLDVLQVPRRRPSNLEWSMGSRHLVPVVSGAACPWRSADNASTI